MSDPPDIHHLLRGASAGDASAAAYLTPLVYGELHGLAARYLSAERPNHTLGATALVHEAFMRMVDQSRVDWKSRAHFVAIAATQMRRVLIDYARRRRAAKRDAGQWRVTLNDGDSGVSELDLLALDDALTRLADTDIDLYHLVELRFFSGLSMSEIAALRGVSLPTVERHWRLARAWLTSAFRDHGAADND